VSGRPSHGSEAWIDAVIREARERGEFDDLPGHGKPLPDLGHPHDDLWWVRKKLKSEGVSFLPPALALRKDKEDTLEAVAAARTERQARELLEALNERIRRVNSSAIEGPPSTVMPLDVEEALAAWRRQRAAAGLADVRAGGAVTAGAEVPGAPDATASSRRRFWRKTAGTKQRRSGSP
jgi:hypothetical protein